MSDRPSSRYRAASPRRPWASDEQLVAMLVDGSAEALGDNALASVHFGAFFLPAIEGDPEKKRKALLESALETLDLSAAEDP